MARSVLGSLTLGYRPLWDRARKPAGRVLYARAATTATVDAAHLLRTLQELWSTGAPRLLLCAQTRQLLCDLLDHATHGAPWIAVHGDWLSEPALCARVQAAQQRGVSLVWRGDLGQIPEPCLARCFDRSLLTLRPEDAVAALQTASDRPGDPVTQPMLVGPIYEGIASRALMVHCLDRRHALALAGWPSEDVLHRLRHRPQQPAHALIFRLMKAMDAEQSLETFEDLLGQDPLLAYRFMVCANSAALGLRSGIDSLRRGLVMLGYGALGRWLADQLPHACTDPDMQPVRQSMVLRARLTAALLDAGVDNDLHREIYLCGLFSQLDALLGEPLGSILRRLPLSGRIHDATVPCTGPYAGGLQIACALEGDDASGRIGPLCETFAMDLEQVNRALLRVLSEPG